ncbi:hypothetical protein [Sphingobacterium sp.]|uniref:hypothetical protein n=1 Tax=Sphingobacterium sp. TaxID=341027 RepID=UPI0031CFD71E
MGKNLRIIILLSLYYYLLIWGYENMIIPKWEYQGFVNESSPENFIMSCLGVVITILSYIVLDKKDTPSSMVMNLFNLLFYIPLYVFIAYTKTVSSFFLFCILYQLALFLCYLYLPISFRPLIPRSKRYFTFIISFVLISTLVINGIYNGFKIKLDLSDVYENRLAVRDISMPSIFNYIKSSSYFVGIIALIYGLKIRNWSFVAFVTLIQLMSFAFGASKTQFFSIFICYIAFFFYTEKLRLWAPISLLFLISISIVEFKIFSTSEISDIWARRSLFVPVKISYTMYDFFETPGREFLYLRGSVFRFLGFEDPYATQEGFQRLIGYMLSGKEATNANTGLLGNDYAQFGWWSLLVFPFLRVYLLKMYDYCAQGVDKRIVVVLSIFIAFTYISGAFFTVLITNGILLVNYLLYCFPREKRL